MKNLKCCAISIILVFFVFFLFFSCINEIIIVGKWELVESSIGKNMSIIKMEYFRDGTAIGESNMMGLGNIAESFKWRIENNRLFLISPSGDTQIYNIIELTNSSLIYEGNISILGNIRFQYKKTR